MPETGWDMLKKLMQAFAAFVMIVVAVIGGAWLVQENPGIFPWGVESEDRDSQVVNAVTRLDQVVLLGLAIQGISEETSQGKILGWDVPGTTRTAFLQYEFDAKLGIEGGEVRIEPQGDDAFLVTVPEFIFIGHDDVSFRLAAVDDGILSWTTPEIDNVETVNRILNDEARQQYVDNNEELLREQARSFYTGVIGSVDPALDVEFEFSG